MGVADRLPAPLLQRLGRLCLVLAALLAVASLAGVLLVRMRQPPEALPPAASTLAAVPLAVPGSATATLAGEIVQRPLFLTGRRPPQPITAPEPEPELPGAGALDDVKLVGTFSSGGQAGVIIRVAGERRRVLLGEAVDAWTLKSVDAKVARFVAPDGRRRQLELEYSGL